MKNKIIRNIVQWMIKMFGREFTEWLPVLITTIPLIYVLGTNIFSVDMEPKIASILLIVILPLAFLIGFLIHNNLD